MLHMKKKVMHVYVHVIAYISPEPESEMKAAGGATKLPKNIPNFTRCFSCGAQPVFIRRQISLQAL